MESSDFIDNNMNNGIITTEDMLDDLCRNIRRLQIEPGAKISENEMAEFYNVSRSSVRTVFSKLEQMLLIKRFPQIGTFISPFDVDYLSNALYVRALIELDAIEKIIALDNNDHIIKKLEENIALQSEYKYTKDYEINFQGVDSNFHNIMLESVNMTGAMDIIKNSNIHIARWRNFDIIYRNKITIMYDEHTQILESIKKSDKNLAQKHVKKHLTIDEFYLNKAQEEYPTYFKKILVR